MTIFFIMLMGLSSTLYLINPELGKLTNSVILVTLSIKAISMGIVSLFLRRNK